MNKEDMMQVVANIEKSNQFEKAFKRAILSFSPSIFNQAYDEYMDFLSKPEQKLSEKEVALKLIKEITENLCKIFKITAFKEEKILDYYDVISESFPSKLFAFILWVQDKKDAAQEILKHYEVEISKKEYDYLILVLLPHRDNPNVPYDTQKRIEYLTKQKEEFYYYHDKYKLAHELASLPSNNKEAKKPKI